jgi:hypothetical protein
MYLLFKTKITPYKFVNFQNVIQLKIVKSLLLAINVNNFSTSPYSEQATTSAELLYMSHRKTDNIQTFYSMTDECNKHPKIVLSKMIKQYDLSCHTKKSSYILACACKMKINFTSFSL